MGLLNKLNNDIKNEDIQGSESDSLGGFVLESDAYKLKIEVAYETTSTNGASGVVLKATGAPIEGGKAITFQNTQWVTGRSGKPYWERDGKKNFLPGYNNITALAALTDSGDLDTEEAVIPVYNYDQRKEVPTKVDMITELIGKEFIAGITKKVVDKNVKDNNGQYVPSGETREENELDKVFSEDGLTVTEIKAGLTSPDFLNKWLDKYRGTVINKAKGAKKGVPTGPATGGLAATATKSGLFADKE